MKKNKSLRHFRIQVLGFLGCLFFLLTAIIVILQGYLYTMQKNERLEKIENYLEFTLSYQKQNRCEKKLKFSFDDISYYYDCLDEVYIHYGSTKATLEEVITKEYLSFNDFIKNLHEIESEEENVRVFVHSSSNDEYSYKVKLSKTEETTEVTIASYDGI